ncbi:hypothetical protein K435DRAFT_796024 [Dendrothele bispora CBS 962.96]|uniref:Uncharacterized protein n=1 Tax=Dendrothele bispora (strain CBS 962.96) TaxID=1314807 RepID=A0A4V4HGA2_DENBC|nr:hypothetical protein K435DRAFT_796024 [Dendrothele bispora CBS 962.96]
MCSAGPNSDGTCLLEPGNRLQLRPIFSCKGNLSITPDPELPYKTHKLQVQMKPGSEALGFKSLETFQRFTGFQHDFESAKKVWEKEFEDMISKIKSGGSLDLKCAVVTASDLQRLAVPRLLNDEVIQAYIELFKYTLDNPGVFIFGPLEWSSVIEGVDRELENMFQKNLTMKTWIECGYSSRKKKEPAFDPIVPLDWGTWAMIPYLEGQAYQVNNYDCGCYAIGNLTILSLSGGQLESPIDIHKILTPSTTSLIHAELVS